MNFTRALVIFTLLILTTSGPVFAQTTGTDAATNSATSLTPQRPLSADQREIIKSKITEIKGRIATQAAELKSQLADKVKQRVTDLFQIMLKRMQHLLERQASILERLQSRIEKMESAGKTISSNTSDLLTQAQESHAKSVTQLESLQTKFAEQILNSETPKEGLALFRQLTKEFTVQLHATQQLIKQVLAELQKASK